MGGEQEVDRSSLLLEMVVFITASFSMRPSTLWASSMSRQGVTVTSTSGSTGLHPARHRLQLLQTADREPGHSLRLRLHHALWAHRLHHYLWNGDHHTYPQCQCENRPEARIVQTGHPESQPTILLRPSHRVLKQEAAEEMRRENI